MRSRLILLALLAGAAGDVPAQQACTDEMAWTKAGSRARSEDDLATADPGFPKTEYPAALRMADRVVALLQQAIPKLNGIEARVYRSIRDRSYTKDGALKYGVNALFLGYYCVPDTPSYPKLRGQIRLATRPAPGSTSASTTSSGWRMNARGSTRACAPGVGAHFSSFRSRPVSGKACRCSGRRSIRGRKPRP
jgi:hypothetical protein